MHGTSWLFTLFYFTDPSTALSSTDVKYLKGMKTLTKNMFPKHAPSTSTKDSSSSFAKKTSAASTITSKPKDLNRVSSPPSDNKTASQNSAPPHAALRGKSNSTDSYGQIMTGPASSVSTTMLNLPTLQSKTMTGGHLIAASSSTNSQLPNSASNVSVSKPTKKYESIPLPQPLFSIDPAESSGIKSNTSFNPFTKMRDPILNSLMEKVSFKEGDTFGEGTSSLSVKEPPKTSSNFTSVHSSVGSEFDIPIPVPRFGLPLKLPNLTRQVIGDTGISSVDTQGITQSLTHHGRPQNADSRKGYSGLTETIHQADRFPNKSSKSRVALHQNAPSRPMTPYSMPTHIRAPISKPPLPGFYGIPYGHYGPNTNAPLYSISKQPMHPHHFPRSQMNATPSSTDLYASIGKQDHHPWTPKQRMRLPLDAAPTPRHKLDMNHMKTLNYASQQRFTQGYHTVYGPSIDTTSRIPFHSHQPASSVATSNAPTKYNESLRDKENMVPTSSLMPPRFPSNQNNPHTMTAPQPKSDMAASLPKHRPDLRFPYELRQRQNDIQRHSQNPLALPGSMIQDSSHNDVNQSIPKQIPRNDSISSSTVDAPDMPFFDDASGTIADHAENKTDDPDYIPEDELQYLPPQPPRKNHTKTAVQQTLVVEQLPAVNAFLDQAGQVSNVMVDITNNAQHQRDRYQGNSITKSLQIYNLTHCTLLKF